MISMTEPVARIAAFESGPRAAAGPPDSPDSPGTGGRRFAAAAPGTPAAGIAGGAAQHGGSAPFPNGDAGSEGRRPRVFVVEDDAHDREIYGRILCYNGYDVMFAGSGAAALGLATSHAADAVLLDLGLPDADGLQVLAQLRQRPGYGATPVIALSGFTRRLRGTEALSAGCAEYIEKPARPVAVLHAIEDLIGRAPLPGVGTPPQMLEQPE